MLTAHLPSGYVLIRAQPRRRTKPLIRQAGMWFFAAWFMHLCLDTIVGSIMWLWPFSTAFYQFATVPATYDHFVLSFILHWSFALEIIVWLTAVWLWRNRHPA